MHVQQRRLLFPWFVLVFVIYMLPYLCGPCQAYRDIVGHDSNRWLHFLLYMAVVAISLVATRGRISIPFALATAVPAILLEFLCGGATFAGACAQTVQADLFGIASGILLGWNLRIMHDGTHSAHSEQSNE